MTQAYPLSWPVGYPRTQHRKQSRFGRSLAESRDDLLDQIRRLGGTSVIISSNAKLRNDGLPYSKQPTVDDSGVAVYFTYQNQQVVFACDKWEEIGENIRALGLAIEAIRGLERWGVSDMLPRTFTGFMALPSGGGVPVTIEPSVQDWRTVLKLPKIANWDTVTKAYRKRRVESHPDKGGSNEEFTAVEAAYQQAKQHFGYK